MSRFFRFDIFLRGLLMGAADVVPGVSGGTIAFITGIYEELIHSIKNLNFKLLNVWRKEGFASFWNQANGSFLLSLLFGIGISILSLARIVTRLIESQPIAIWSFFFGLVLASAIYIGKQIKPWQITHVILFVVGVVLAYQISQIHPSTGNDSSWYLFVAGAIAICAMILPGISGSLILILLGAYRPIFEAISKIQFSKLIPVAAGAVIGIVLFSKFLSYLFSHYKNQTLALLTGFMIGALNKLWPWKEAIETFIDRHGETRPLIEKNISPANFSALYQQSSQIEVAVVCAIFGVGIVFFIEYINKKLS